MTRNHFSKYGGPCFVNDGTSMHDHDHKPDKPHEDIKPDMKVFYFIASSFGVLITSIGIGLYFIN